MDQLNPEYDNGLDSGEEEEEIIEPTVLPEIIIELKKHLRITWDEENADLEALLNRGKAAFKRLFGLDIDYDANPDIKELLFNWCRYSRNNSLEYFQSNFREEINTIAFGLAVEDIKGEENET